MIEKIEKLFWVSIGFYVICGGIFILTGVLISIFEETNFLKITFGISTIIVGILTIIISFLVWYHGKLLLKEAEEELQNERRKLSNM